jgi:preprotein translocase subunit SecD
MTLSKPQKVFIFIVLLVFASLYIVLPSKIPFHQTIFGKQINFDLAVPRINLKIGNIDLSKEIELKQGLDIRGGLQVVLKADMKDIKEEDRSEALESVKNVIGRRVDLFGVSESSVKTAISSGDYRLILEIPGITDPKQANRHRSCYPIWFYSYRLNWCRSSKGYCYLGISKRISGCRYRLQRKW